MNDFSEDEKTDPSLILPSELTQAKVVPPPPPLMQASAQVSGQTSGQASGQVSGQAPANQASAQNVLPANMRMPEMGILNSFMKDPEVTEIMVNDLRNIMIEKNGQVFQSPQHFTSIEELQRLTRSILDITGRILSPDSPYVDTMLPDGSRVNIVTQPLTQLGPCLTIRKFPTRRFTLEDLLQNGLMDKRMAYLLQACTVGRLNLIISGGTGSGKTTLLNALAMTIPKIERVVTIEDTPELIIQQINSVKLQTKPQMPASPPVTARELVANSLRMRPDRIILGECRRGEAFDMLQAMNTGHAGSMTSIHANSARDALSRLETLCMMAGVDLPVIAIRRQIAEAIDVIVQTKRFRDGKRRVIGISEVTGMEGEIITTQDIFMTSPDGTQFKCTGFVPTFLERLKENGVELPAGFFA
jgi:Flp pilus assembly CpaF family ATPase